jgi:hypothetical protein
MDSLEEENVREFLPPAEQEVPPQRNEEEEGTITIHGHHPLSLFLPSSSLKIHT